VTDVAVLVVAPSAHDLFFPGIVEAKGTSVVLGHRLKLHAFLCAMLPGAAVDPYADLLEPTPPCCVRVLIVDDESLTVMSYGSFVTIRDDPANRAVA
jgi:hypothetical protein